MHSTVTKKHGHIKSYGQPEKAREAERRIAERHMFTAAAEVIELQSGARFSTRTMDLGPGGCFVDTTVPLPIGSKVRIALQKGKTNFKTAGNVVYSQPGLGMGIAFDAHEAEQRVALDEWIAEVTGNHFASHDRSHEHASHAAPATSHGFSLAAHHRSAEWVAMVRLVQLMIGKGILTEAEGTSILHDPVL
ncbi:MAG TPA: PilZ domain-containing protein [Candidatus Acidoferrales bacterium]